MWSRSRRLFHSEIKIVHSGKLNKSVPISKFKAMTKTMNNIEVPLRLQFGDRDWTALKTSSVSSVTFGVVLGYVPADSKTYRCRYVTTEHPATVS